MAVIATSSVHNPSSFARADEALYWSFYDLGLSTGKLPQPIVAVVNGSVVPSQLVDNDGDGTSDGVFTVLDFAPGATHDVTIQYASDTLKPKVAAKKTQAEISHKDGGKWEDREGVAGIKNYIGGKFKNVTTLTPASHYADHSNWIRYEGPGIESDKVGYRIYLDWRNGFDIFGKNYASPILQKVGQDGYESYHHPQEWGLDILKVGSSLGAGGFGYWDNGAVVTVKDTQSRTATIVENGDLRSGVKIAYNGWKVAGKSIDVDAYITMEAGSRLAHNSLTLSEDLPVIAAGIVNHENTTYIEGPKDIPSDSYTYIATWGKQSLAGDHLGMAVFVKKRDLKEFTFDGTSRIALLKPALGKVDYYFAAAWQGEHGNRGIDNIEAFKQYLREEAQKLTRPVRQDITTTLTLAEAKKPLTQAQALHWAKALADSELQRKTLKYHLGGWDTNRKKQPKFEYDVVGMLPLAYEELGKAVGDTRYTSVKNKVTATYIQDDGTISRYEKKNFNIDSVAPGRTVLRLLDETKDQKYKLAADVLREQLRDQPRTSNGAFWHKQRYPYQLWLDGVYMGMPFLAEYSLRFENGEHIEEAVNEFRVSRKILRDPKTGLYHHAWDEKKQQIWADPKTGLSPHFWARGMGWMTMAIVDVLDYIPESHSSERHFLKEMSVELAKTLKQYQDKKTNTWWQILDKPGEVGNYHESSASAMYVYFLAKAIDKGYLTDANFGGDVKAFALKSYQGLLNEFTLVHPDGKVSYTNICHVAGLGFGRDGSYDYYMDESVVSNDPKGTAPFIFASIAISKLL